MEGIVKVLPMCEAARLQTEAGEFACRVIDFAVLAGGEALIAIVGTAENLKSLFKWFDNEGKETEDV